MMVWAVTLLPQPEAPTRATASPGWMFREMELRICLEPLAVENVKERSRMVSRGVVIFFLSECVM